jgi:hypothetical protein
VFFGADDKVKVVFNELDLDKFEIIPVERAIDGLGGDNILHKNREIKDCAARYSANSSGR